ncbi:phage distal tail protein [Anaerosalibacter massiliensis]|uniref:phage distal tail protein n=1 Tax=Anaerosalibacter massiliensis TaxID=1347392 RepID=UPI0005B28D06|nr:hypothetical protein [Anaerosalibacter massiliensis]
MKINNKDTKEFGAILLDYNIDNSELITYDDWLDNSFSPSTHRQVFKFSYLECEFLFQQKNDDLAEMMISNFIKHSSTAEITIDDLSRTYKGVLDEADKEKIVKGKYELRLKWKCEYSFKIESDFILEGREGSIFVPGNIKTPAIVEIIPKINLIDLSIKGLGEDITIKNLKANVPVIINSEDGLITENGKNKFNETDMWEFPYLVPGTNQISIDKDNVDIKIKYKSRWI